MSGLPFDGWVLPPGVEASDESLRTFAGGPDLAAVRAPEMTGPRMARIVASLREGQRALALRPWRSIADAVGRVADRLLRGSDPLRSAALSALDLTTPLSQPMAAAVLDGTARHWQAPRLRAMVEAEGLAHALDAMAPGPNGVSLRARGLPVTLHLGAGTVPGVSATSLIRALMVKSAAWIKPGLGDVALPVILARALAETDPELASVMAVSYWPGDAMPRGILDAVDLVVAYGGNETVRAIRASLPPTTTLVAYHHRLSFGVVAREAAADGAVAGEVARAAAMFDQRGCVSPHLVFVEGGGSVSPEAWAEGLAQACAAVAIELPPGQWSAEEASAVQQTRGAAELRGTVDAAVRVSGGGDLAWTVVLDPEAIPTPPCLARTLIVRPVDDVDQVAGLLAGAGPVLQSVGWAGPRVRAERLAEQLSALGVTRVSGFRDQPFPPAWWRHDGQPPLAPLVRWTQVEV